MITNDFFMFVSKSNVSCREDIQSKKYERGKNSDFEGILNSKKDASIYQASQIRNNSRINSINNNNQNSYGMRSTDNIKKEQTKDSDFSGVNQNNQIKNTKHNNEKDREKTDTNLEETGKENENASNYNYSTSLALSIIDFDNVDLINSIDEVSKSLLSEVSTINHLADSISDDGIEIETVQKEAIMTAEPDETKTFFELDDITKQQYEIINNQETEITQTNVEDNEEQLFTIGPKKSNENIIEGTKHNNLIRKPSNDEKNQVVNKTADSQVEVDLSYKDISLNNVNEEMELVNNKEVQLTDDMDTQTVIKPKEQNVFSQFNDNNLNFSGKALAEGFNSVAKQGTFTLDKESIFEQIVEKVKMDMDNTDEVRVKLKPEFLGEISLKLSTEKGVITAKAYVENFNVKQLIESNLDNLKENMKELGLNFEALDVSVGKDSGFERNNGRAWKQSQRFKAKRPSIDRISGSSAYEEDIKQIVGGLYSAEGNIDLIV